MSILATVTRPELFYHHTHDEHPGSGMRHCHDQYEMYFFISGSGEFFIEGSQVNLFPYTLLLMRPVEFHYFHLTGSTPYERCALHFSASLLPESDQAFLLSSFGLPDAVDPEPPVYPIQQYPELIAAFSRLDRACKLPEDEQLLMIRAILMEILTMLIGCRRRPRQTESSARMLTRTLVSEIVDYLNAHLSERLSLDQLTSHFFISKYHLCRTFKQSTGLTVLEYMTEKRIFLAKALLQQGVSPTAVASRCGFTDYSAFYRAFKNLTGYSPSQIGRDLPESSPEDLTTPDFL